MLRAGDDVHDPGLEPTGLCVGALSRLGLLIPAGPEVADAYVELLAPFPALPDAAVTEVAEFWLPAEADVDMLSACAEAEAVIAGALMIDAGGRQSTTGSWKGFVWSAVQMSSV